MVLMPSSPESNPRETSSGGANPDDYGQSKQAGHSTTKPVTEPTVVDTFDQFWAERTGEPDIPVHDYITYGDPNNKQVGGDPVVRYPGALHEGRQIKRVRGKDGGFVGLKETDCEKVFSILLLFGYYDSMFVI